MEKLKAIFMTAHAPTIEYYKKGGIMQKIDEYANVYPEIICKANMEKHIEALKNAEIIFSTWGMEHFTQEEIRKYMPHLKAVFYAAGSVRGFAEPFINENIIVMSSWAANAVPVAEYCLGLILLANKGFYTMSKLYKEKGTRPVIPFGYPGNMDIKVGILGAGMIGSKLIELLKPFSIDVLLYDPFCSDEKAQKLGVTKVATLEEVFENADVISNHIANLPQTQKIINKNHFSKMKEHAVFINTGRGAQIVEADLIEALKEKPYRLAILDVTDPEPVGVDSPFLELDNVIISPHIAGSINNEIARMMDYAADEFIRFCKGEPLKYAVSKELLITMA